MPILAVSDVVWNALIAGAVTIILAWMQNRTKKAVVETGTNADVKADVREQKLDDVAKKIEVVHKTTNSMKDELVQEVRQAGFAAGVKSETDKGNQ